MKRLSNLSMLVDERDWLRYYSSPDKVMASGVIANVPKRLQALPQSDIVDENLAPVCNTLLRNGYDLRLGESGRSILKKEISRRLKASKPARQLCLAAVGRLKNANVHQLIAMAELSGCLPLALHIANDHWKECRRKTSARTPFSSLIRDIRKPHRTRFLVRDLPHATPKNFASPTLYEIEAHDHEEASPVSMIDWHRVHSGPISPFIGDPSTAAHHGRIQQRPPYPKTSTKLNGSSFAHTSCIGVPYPQWFNVLDQVVEGVPLPTLSDTTPISSCDEMFPVELLLRDQNPFSCYGRSHWQQRPSKHHHNSAEPTNYSNYDLSYTAVSPTNLFADKRPEMDAAEQSDQADYQTCCFTPLWPDQASDLQSIYSSPPSLPAHHDHLMPLTSPLSQRIAIPSFAAFGDNIAQSAPVTPSPYGEAAASSPTEHNEMAERRMTSAAELLRASVRQPSLDWDENRRPGVFEPGFCTQMEQNRPLDHSAAAHCGPSATAKLFPLHSYSQPCQSLACSTPPPLHQQLQQTGIEGHPSPQPSFPGAGGVIVAALRTPVPPSMRQVGENPIALALRSHIASYRPRRSLGRLVGQNKENAKENIWRSTSRRRNAKTGSLKQTTNGPQTRVKCGGRAGGVLPWPSQSPISSLSHYYPPTMDLPPVVRDGHSDQCSGKLCSIEMKGDASFHAMWNDQHLSSLNACWVQ